MPDSRTVTVKTDITGEEQHLAGPVWAGVAQASRRGRWGGGGGARRSAASDQLHSENRGPEHAGAAWLSSHLLGVPTLLFLTCVNMDPASLS